MKQNGTLSKANTNKNVKGAVQKSKLAGKATPAKPTGKAKKEALNIAATDTLAENTTPVTTAKSVAKSSKVPAKIGKATPAKKAAAKPAIKKTIPEKKKSKAKVLPPKEVVESEDADDDDNDGDESADEAMLNLEDGDSETEDEGMNGNEDEGNSDDDEDNAGNDAVEMPIQKDDSKTERSRKSSKMPSINFNSIPEGTPIENCILIKNLPDHKTYKNMDIAEVFFKYGNILSIVIYPGVNQSSAHVAYEKAEDAKAALAENNKAKIKDNVIKVKLRKDKQQSAKKEIELYTSVKVENISKDTTEQDLVAHFKKCGEIGVVELNMEGPEPYAIITFCKKKSAYRSLKRNDTLLKEARITVRMVDGEKSEKLTIVLRRRNNDTKVDEAKLQEIFGKCGTIKFVDILNRPFVLAFITFDEEDAVIKAMELKGTTVDGIELDIEQFKNYTKEKMKIFMQNVPETVTNNEIHQHFQDIGKILEIRRAHDTATVTFENSDAFCKSFLLNEALLGGVPTFIRPFSFLRVQMIKDQKEKRSIFSGQPAKKRPSGGQQSGVKQNGAVPHFYTKGGVPNKRSKK